MDSEHHWDYNHIIEILSTILQMTNWPGGTESVPCLMDKQTSQRLYHRHRLKRSDNEHPRDYTLIIEISSTTPKMTNWPRGTESVPVLMDKRTSQRLYHHHRLKRSDNEHPRDYTLIIEISSTIPKMTNWPRGTESVPVLMDKRTSLRLYPHHSPNS